MAQGTHRIHREALRSKGIIGFIGSGGLQCKGFTGCIGGGTAQKGTHEIHRGRHCGARDSQDSSGGGSAAQGTVRTHRMHRGRHCGAGDSSAQTFELSSSAGG